MDKFLLDMLVSLDGSWPASTAYQSHQFRLAAWHLEQSSSSPSSGDPQRWHIPRLRVTWTTSALPSRSSNPYPDSTMLAAATASRRAAAAMVAFSALARASGHTTTL